MKVVDHAGNSIVSGRLLRWQPSPQGGPGDYYVKVADVVKPTQDEPGKVVITLTFGIQKLTKKDDMDHGAVRFADFVTVLDPEDELRTEAVLAKAVGDGPVLVKEQPHGFQPE